MISTRLCFGTTLTACLASVLLQDAVGMTASESFGPRSVCLGGYGFTGGQEISSASPELPVSSHNESVATGVEMMAICPPPCEGDVNGDCQVNPIDYGFVTARMGCPVGTGDPLCDAADVNDDGSVCPLDQGFVAARFGPC